MSKKLKFYYYIHHEGYNVYCSQNMAYICAVDIPCITVTVLTLVRYGIKKREEEMFREILE